MSWSRKRGLPRIYVKEKMRLLRDTFHPRLFISSRIELIAEIRCIFNPRVIRTNVRALTWSRKIFLRRESTGRSRVIRLLCVVLVTRLRRTPFVHSNRRRITLWITCCYRSMIASEKNTLEQSQQISPFSRCIRARHSTRVVI